MATYTAQQLNGAGTPTEVLSGQKTFTLTNPLNGSAYFTVETVRNATGSYANKPTNALGTYATFVGIDIDTLITSSYISSVVVPSGNSSYKFTPPTIISGNNVTAQTATSMTDSTVNFNTLGVKIGDLVTDTVNGDTANVTAITSDTELAISANIFSVALETYSITTTITAGSSMLRATGGITLTIS